MSNDPIIDAFIKNYGILNLLKDMGAKKLQKGSSSQYQLCCLFHSENNPSMSIQIKEGKWHCFTCNIGGYLYQLIQMYYKMDFKTAKKFITERSGLNPNSNFEDISFYHDIESKLEEVNSVVHGPFNFKYLNDDEIKMMYIESDPFHYLENRGYNKFDIDYFECGFTPKWRAFNKETEQVEEQPRITIPGHDEYGNVIGFIARTPIDDNPKYLYTRGYPKTHTLFNIHRAKTHAQNGLILVEGSLDCMRVHSLGYPNVCAILGAALNENQIKILLKYTNTVYLMFDSDTAGKNATKEAIENLDGDLNILYVQLKNNKDPGEITDKDELTSLIKSAKNWDLWNIM